MCIINRIRYIENMADEQVESVEFIELSSDSESKAEITGVNLKPLRELPASSGNSLVSEWAKMEEF